MSSETGRKIHLTMMVFWAGNLPIVIVTYVFFHHVWLEVSILYLALVSIYANFVGHWSGWSAERPTQIEH